MIRIQSPPQMNLSELREWLEMLLEGHDVKVLEVRSADADSSRAAKAQEPVPNPLSPSERRVLRALTRFDNTAEMAERLGKSVHTVEKHIENMERKLKVRSRARLVYRAMVLGYLR